MFEQRIAEQLAQRTQAGLLRQRQISKSQGKWLYVNDHSYLNFAGNDYLGLASAQRSSGVESGATASPVVTGYTELHRELEQTLLAWLNAPEHFSCLLYSSGFAANTGVISALYNRKDTDAVLLQDKLNHASLMDVGKHMQALRHCRQHRFMHNNMDQLSQLLAQKCSDHSPKLIVTEGIFSMDGDGADLCTLRKLSKAHKAWLMVDDAHGIGVHGACGQGSFAEAGLNYQDTDIHVVTFGKALGTQGAAVIAAKDTIEYLVNFSREYVYSTHLSPLQAAATLGNIQRLQQQAWRREKLKENIALFRDKAAKLPYTVLPSYSAIQPIVIGDESKTREVAEALKAKGIWTGAMRYPTVAKGQARLRVTLSANHERGDIINLFDALTMLAEEGDA